MIGKLTTGKFAGLMTGLGVSAVIQSSSATTVMAELMLVADTVKF